MSMTYSFYMGPYAEWLVPHDHFHGIIRKIFEMSEEFDGNNSILSRACFEGWENPKGFVYDCWKPYWLRTAKGQPERPRKFSWTEDNNDLGMWEFEGISAKREIKWFERTVRAELKQLSELYEADPVLKWGVVVEKG